MLPRNFCLLLKYYTLNLVPYNFFEALCVVSPGLDVPVFLNLLPITLFKVVEQIRVFTSGVNLEAFRATQDILFGSRQVLVDA